MRLKIYKLFQRCEILGPYRDQFLSQVLCFGLNSETIFISNYFVIHKIVDIKFSLRFGLKLTYIYFLSFKIKVEIVY